MNLENKNKLYHQIQYLIKKNTNNFDQLTLDLVTMTCNLLEDQEISAMEEDNIINSQSTLKKSLSPIFRRVT